MHIFSCKATAHAVRSSATVATNPYLSRSIASQKTGFWFLCSNRGASTRNACFSVIRLLRLFSGVLCLLAAPLSQAVVRELPSAVDTPMAVSTKSPESKSISLYVGPDAATVRVGLYLAEPPDSEREVVIFVHGANGGPGDFREWIAALDHAQYQIWVADYPSALPIATAGQNLADKISRLASAFQLSRFTVIAHSLGGLVAWRMTHVLQERIASPVQLITVATPFDGHPMARWGTLLAKAPQPVWFDLVPGSATLREIWQDTHRPHHTLIAVAEGDPRSTLGDGTIALESQMPPAMTSQAERVLRWQGTHTGVLEDPNYTKALLGLLHSSLHP